VLWTNSKGTLSRLEQLVYQVIKESLQALKVFSFKNHTESSIYKKGTLGRRICASSCMSWTKNITQNVSSMSEIKDVRHDALKLSKDAIMPCNISSRATYFDRF
jgi:hypothetical protein